jgi:hypothetical protein
MIYLTLTKNTIAALLTKKALLGQWQTLLAKKTYQTDFIQNNTITNVDIVASAIKEILSTSENKKINEKEVILILPQELFSFLRIKVPPDIASSAVESFLKDKAFSELKINLEDYHYTYFTKEINEQKVITLYAFRIEEVEKLFSVFSLINLRLVNILPNSLVYFSLFEKTLSSTKTENVIYLKYGEKNFEGYLFDSFGYLGREIWHLPVTEKGERVVRGKVVEYEGNNIKFNRLILAGVNSDKVRQDFFTKTVGVWTNPLKKIIVNFYQDYVKQLILDNNTPFPVLEYDEVLGAFVFLQTNPNFNFLKRGKNLKNNFKKEINLPKFNLPKKEIIIFIAAFLLSFVILLIINGQSPKIKLSTKIFTPTATPTNTPTPTPTIALKINKEEIKIKVLNGSGKSGKAGEVKDILKKLGYSQIVVGNADNFDYEITEINTKKDKKNIGDSLKKELSQYSSSFKQSILDEKETADVVIIIGADFE